MTECALGGQDTTPKRSIQIGDGEVNSWYFYDETRGSELQCVQGKALAEIAPRPNMCAEYASLLRPASPPASNATISPSGSVHPSPFHKGRTSWSASRALMSEARTASAASREGSQNCTAESKIVDSSI